MKLKTYFNQVLVILFFILISNKAHSDEIDGSSGILWSVAIQNNGNSQTIKGLDLNSVLKSGLRNKKLGVECKFEFTKGFSVKTYSEKIWPECTLNGVKIAVDAISCLKLKSEVSFDDGGLYFNLNEFNFKFMCGYNPKK